MNKIDKSHHHISQMFDNIAPKYDFLNHLLSFNIDKIWRRKVRKIITKYNVKRLLDIATGTGDLALELSKISQIQITGIDISPKMLQIAEKKVAKLNKSHLIQFFEASAMQIPFDDNTFDAATCSFGVRNFENLDKGITETNRVLKSNGILVILEFSKPTNTIFSRIYSFYFKKILPRLVKLFTRHQYAYEYLPNSVDAFPCYDDFMAILEHNNFQPITYHKLTFGIATIYIARKN